MPLFQYVARNVQNQPVRGVAEATSAAVAARMLREQGLTPVSIEMGSAAAARAARRRRGKGGRVKIDDLAVFSRMLATMIRAGLPLIEVINILSEQADKRRLKDALAQAERDVQGGSSFTEALQRHPTIFSQFFISMVRAGEASGMLDTILDLVAIYLEKTASIQRKIRSALTYPTVVGTFALLMTFVLVTKVVPQFEQIFEELESGLPLMTKVTVAVSRFASARWYLMILGIAGLIAGAWAMKRTPQGERAYDRLKLKLPVFGPLLLKVAVARFSRTLSVLVRAGVNILSALDIVANTSGNSLIRDAVLKTRASIQSGETLAKPLIDAGVFPPMVTRMVDVGERTGALETMLSKVADFYEDQVDATVGMLMSLIEPLMIIFLGVIVGFVVISMFLPLFKMIEVLGAEG
ncbi:type II secretion system F family protein [Candidatus Sumerlaeota bacterium]|nr:type II secretion system F family protein [Candidatus Sumerlaeota bacterium]